MGLHFFVQCSYNFTESIPQKIYVFLQIILSLVIHYGYIIINKIFQEVREQYHAR